MKTLMMNKFGKVLTGREFGVDSMKKINSTIEYPVILDFMDVISLGSTFADEVLVPIAKKQNNHISVCNVKAPVLACIKYTAHDEGIKIDIVDGL